MTTDVVIAKQRRGKNKLDIDADSAVSDGLFSDYVSCFTFFNGKRTKRSAFSAE
jgi:hypothetical protein